MAGEPKASIKLGKQENAVTANQNIYSDAVLWYAVGRLGSLGYGVPNPSNDVGTLNPTIADIVHMLGRNMFLIMHHEDVDLTTPPSVNTCHRLHMLVIRASQILTGRAVPPGVPNLETDHVSPAGETFRVWPTPYFLVRNRHLKQYCGWAMMAASEAMQHTENRKSIEISTHFAASIGKYLERIYHNMSIELFGKTRDEAIAPGFRLTDDDFAGYDPSKYFTSQEMIDTVPALDNVFTEDRLREFAGGIPVSQLPALQPWPTNLTLTYDQLRKQLQDQTNPDTGEPAHLGDQTQPNPLFPKVASFLGA